jgi:hypothetical protein
MTLITLIGLDTPKTENDGTAFKGGPVHGRVVVFCAKPTDPGDGQAAMQSLEFLKRKVGVCQNEVRIEESAAAPRVQAVPCFDAVHPGRIGDMA